MVVVAAMLGGSARREPKNERPKYVSYELQLDSLYVQVGVLLFFYIAAPTWVLLPVAAGAEANTKAECPSKEGQQHQTHADLQCKGHPHEQR